MKGQGMHNKEYQTNYKQIGKGQEIETSIEIAVVQTAVHHIPDDTVRLVYWYPQYQFTASAYSSRLKL